MRIILDQLEGPEIKRFLEDHLADMKSVSPPESTHALDLEALKKPTIQFWTAWNGDRLVGCCALKQIDPLHGEVKSMRVAPTERGQGIGSQLVRHLIGEAAKQGFRRLSLETGAFPFFFPAHALYRRHGFTDWTAFADYKPDKNSLFMTREI